MRVTVAVPALMIEDANHYAMCLGFSAEDSATYRGLNWIDASGNEYAAASFEARQEWIVTAQSPLVRPAWDAARVVNVTGAERARAAVVFSLEPVLALPSAITAIGGLPGADAIIAMGLVPNPDYRE